jgi:hypothetical protein
MSDGKEIDWGEVGARFKANKSVNKKNNDKPEVGTKVEKKKELRVREEVEHHLDMERQMLILAEVSEDPDYEHDLARTHLEMVELLLEIERAEDEYFQIMEEKDVLLERTTSAMRPAVQRRAAPKPRTIERVPRPPVGLGAFQKYATAANKHLEAHVKLTAHANELKGQTSRHAKRQSHHVLRLAALEKKAAAVQHDLASKHAAVGGQLRASYRKNRDAIKISRDQERLKTNKTRLRVKRKKEAEAERKHASIVRRSLRTRAKNKSIQNAAELAIKKAANRRMMEPDAAKSAPPAPAAPAKSAKKRAPRANLPREPRTMRQMLSAPELASHAQRDAPASRPAAQPHDDRVLPKRPPLPDLPAMSSRPDLSGDHGVLADYSGTLDRLRTGTVKSREELHKQIGRPRR